MAESGIKTAKDIQVLKDAGVNGVLIGETLMRSPDKAAMLAAPQWRSLMTKIKICGLKRTEDISYVNELLPDFAGFVFAKSSRQVDAKKQQN